MNDKVLTLKQAAAGGYRRYIGNYPDGSEGRTAALKKAAELTVGSNGEAEFEVMNNGSDLDALSHSEGQRYSIVFRAK
jgi:hypothetical protein